MLYAKRKAQEKSKSALLMIAVSKCSVLFTQVLVKTLFDRGVLIILSSSQMVESKGTAKLFCSLNSLLCQSTYLLPWANVLQQNNKKPSAMGVSEKRGRLEKNLQALFIFQESRIVAKHCKYYSLYFLMASVCVTLANPRKLFSLASPLLRQRHDSASLSLRRLIPIKRLFPPCALSFPPCTTPCSSFDQTPGRTSALAWNGWPPIT